MMDNLLAASIALGAGAALAAFARLALGLDKPFALLATLFVPGLLWLAVNGGIQSMKANETGFELIFANAANASVSQYAADFDAVTISNSGMVAQTYLGAPAAELPPDMMAAAVTEGTKTGRVFLWFPVGELRAPELAAALRKRGAALGSDALRQYLMFGPEVGRIACYIPDTSLSRRLDAVVEALMALEFVPAEARGTVLRDTEVCREPFAADVTALAALRAMAEAEQDEAIVVRGDATYLGLIYRDRLVSALFQTIVDAAPKPAAR